MTQTRPPIRLRGRSFMAMVLAPDPPVLEWLGDLDGLARRAPAFFAGRPVLLDVSGLGLGRSDLEGLVADLAARGIALIGIEGAAADALGPGLPPRLGGGRPAAGIEAPDAGNTAAAPACSLMLDQPVRSGRSVVHLDGDVCVMGAVSSGAEVVAGGSIHVYGALRGRAIAGASGDPLARILCRRFEPELVAIDGLYRTADDLGEGLRGRPAQVRLVEDALRVSALDA